MTFCGAQAAVAPHRTRARRADFQEGFELADIVYPRLVPDIPLYIGVYIARIIVSRINVLSEKARVRPPLQPLVSGGHIALPVNSRSSPEPATRFVIDFGHQKNFALLRRFFAV
jgi:hypothetical protein